jgi:flagellar motility protein MotE (MotC chaperone)
MFNGRFGSPRFRVLPIMLIAVFSMLTVKVSDLYTDFADLAQSMRIEQNEAHAADAVPGAVQTATTAELPRDPSRFSQSEIDLLQALATRRDALDKREQALDQREEFVAAAEKRLDEKIASLESMKAEMVKLLDARSAQEDDRLKQEDGRLKGLVRIYEAMKPKEAAQILQRLDMDVLLGVVERMKDSKVAPILASMDPDKAQAVTALLVERRNMPAAQGDTTGR